MPIFDYYCESCDLTFEKLVFQRDASVQCPSCSAEVKKRPSRFAIRGTGADGKGTGAGSSCSGCTSGNCSSCSGG